MIEFGMLCYIIFSAQSDDAEFCKLADNILQNYKNNLLQIPLEDPDEAVEYILPNSPPEPAAEEEMPNPEPEEFEVVKEEPREQVNGPQQQGDTLYEDISSASDSESESEGPSYQVVRLCPSCQEPMEMAEVPEKMKVRILSICPKSLE